MGMIFDQNVPLLCFYLTASIQPVQSMGCIAVRVLSCELQ